LERLGGFCSDLLSPLCDPLVGAEMLLKPVNLHIEKRFGLVER
jgi:hypothetical protein